MSVTLAVYEYRDDATGEVVGSGPAHLRYEGTTVTAFAEPVTIEIHTPSQAASLWIVALGYERKLFPRGRPLAAGDTFNWKQEDGFIAVDVSKELDRNPADQGIAGLCNPRSLKHRIRP